MNDSIKKEDVMWMYCILRRLYLNAQGTDNIYCLKPEEVQSLQFIEKAILDKFERTKE